MYLILFLKISKYLSLRIGRKRKCIRFWSKTVMPIKLYIGHTGRYLLHRNNIILYARHNGHVVWRLRVNDPNCDGDTIIVHVYIKRVIHASGYTGHRPVLREVGGCSSNTRSAKIPRTDPRPHFHVLLASFSSYSSSSSDLRRGRGPAAIRRQSTIRPCTGPPVQLAQFLRCNVCSESHRAVTLSAIRALSPLHGSTRRLAYTFRIRHPARFTADPQQELLRDPHQSRHRRHAPTIFLERLPVGADHSGGIDGRGPADRGPRRIGLR